MSVDGRAVSGPDGLARERAERALLLAVDTGNAPWSVTESLDELDELARTAGAEVVGRMSQKLEHPDPRTYLGRGKLQEARELAHQEHADLVILDIFAQRARTHEGRAQVELARLEYLLPRLTRAWTHLERQVGGIGVRGGPGETQIEIDRRLIRTRIGALKREIGGFRPPRPGHRSPRGGA